MIRLGVGLMHWPVLDRQKKVVATNITNLDVHDIARVCKVYGVDQYHVIHPAHEQLMFVERMLEHWRIGDGKRFNPMRATALTMVHTAPSLRAAREAFDPETIVVGTTARVIEGVERASFRELRTFMQMGAAGGSVVSGPEMCAAAFGGELESAFSDAVSERLVGKKSLFLLFGTGFGMTEEVLRGCDLLLEPMRGAPPLDYRHLSVRSAVSICLDRLLGAW